MKTLLFSAFAAFTLHCTTHGQEAVDAKPVTAAKKPQDKLRKILDDSCQGFDIFTLNDNAKTEGKVVFRWDNPLRGSADGCTALWYDKGRRPIAIASIFPIRDTLHHDFDLLDRRKGAYGKLQGKEFWRTPATAKLKFQPIKGAAKPPASGVLRQVQLKALAAKFSVDLLGWRQRKADRESLRMLPEPIHRYGTKKKTKQNPSTPPVAATSKVATAQNNQVSEGAIFLFVQGTDPEAALLIEAHKGRGDEYQWEYAFIPQTSGALEGKFEKSVVWKKATNENVAAHGYSARPIPQDAQRQ